MKTKGTPGGAQRYAEAHRRHRRWLVSLCCLAALAVFGTVYALVTPATALEGETFCGREEHTHTDACYESVLACGLEEDGEHVHDESCYEETLACGLEEHTHTDECYVNPEETEDTEDTEEAAEVTAEKTEEKTDAVAAEAEEAAAIPDGAQVPDGYTEQYTVRDEDNGFAVTVYAPEGVVPEGAALRAALLDEGGDAYAAAGTALLAEIPETLSANGGDESEDAEASCGFAALDIHFEDAEGNEVEPDGDVYVVIDAEGILPGDADPETVTVQHHAESDGDVNVETVADTAEETDGVVAVADETTVQAAFAVDSFSTFTITWSNYFTVTIHYVDENGAEIQGMQTRDVSIKNNEKITFADYAGDIDGYAYSAAHYGSVNGNEVTRMVTSQESIWEFTIRYLTFYNGGDKITELHTGLLGDDEADVYLVYKSNETGGGGSGGGTITQNATVTTSKTAVLKNDDSGNYDLTLSITGDRGSEEQKVAANVLFILDNSGSMEYRLGSDSNPGWNEDSRMDLLKDAVDTLVTTIEGNGSIEASYAAVAFARSQTTTTTQGWVTAETLTNYVERLNPNGGTNYQQGIYSGKQLLNSADPNAITFVIFISDGEPTYRGVNVNNSTGSNTNGNGQNDNGGYNIDAAVTEISSMSCDYFYAIGMGPEFTQNGTGMNNLNSLAKAVQSNNTGVYSATDEDSFTKAFEDITSSITFFAASNVTISDPLSEYAEMVLDASGNPQFTITVTRAAYTDSDGTQHTEQTWKTETPVGNNGTLTFMDANNNNVTVTASYNSETKTITLDFPDDYELEEGYTYSISTVIEPSQAAISAGMDSEAAKQTPDNGTGTHADKGETGFWSNDNNNAEVTFTANSEEGSTLFPKPVIQVTKASTVDITVIKVDAQDNNTKLSDAEFYLTKTENDTTLYYKYDVSTGVTWVVSMDDATKFTSSSEEGDYGTFTITALEDGTYSLVEVTAPDGYQLPGTSFTFTVTEGKVASTSAGNGSYTDNTLTVTNTTGQILPETGGAGTTFLTISGLLIMAAAVGGGYALRRRRGREGA